MVPAWREAPITATERGLSRRSIDLTTAPASRRSAASSATWVGAMSITTLTTSWSVLERRAKPTPAKTSSIRRLTTRVSATKRLMPWRLAALARCSRRMVPRPRPWCASSTTNATSASSLPTSRSYCATATSVPLRSARSARWSGSSARVRRSSSRSDRFGWAPKYRMCTVFPESPRWNADTAGASSGVMDRIWAVVPSVKRTSTPAGRRPGSSVELVVVSLGSLVMLMQGVLLGGSNKCAGSDMPRSITALAGTSRGRPSSGGHESDGRRGGVAVQTTSPTGSAWVAAGKVAGPGARPMCRRGRIHLRHQPGSGTVDPGGWEVVTPPPGSSAAPRT